MILLHPMRSSTAAVPLQSRPGEHTVDRWDGRTSRRTVRTFRRVNGDVAPDARCRGRYTRERSRREATAEPSELTYSAEIVTMADA